MIIKKKEGVSYIIKVMRRELLLSVAGVTGLIISTIIYGSNLGPLIVAFLIINDVKALFFVLKAKHSAKEIVRALRPNHIFSARKYIERFH